MFRISFCAVPAFSLVEPARISGPTTTAMSCSTRPRQLRVVHAHDAHGERTGRTCGTESAEDVRRPPTRADTRRRRPPAETARSSISRPARVLVVLRRFLVDRRRGRSAGDQGDDLSRLGREGRLAFGGVERRETSRGAGTDVDQATAPLQPCGDAVDRASRSRRPPLRLPRGRVRPPRSSGRRGLASSADRDRRRPRSRPRSPIRRGRLSARRRCAPWRPSLRRSASGGQYHFQKWS